MKVSELIEALRKCRNQDAEVFVWVDGDRMRVDSIDDWAEEYVDINGADERSAA